MEVSMKAIFGCGLMSLCLLQIAPSAMAAAPTCINTRDIVSSQTEGRGAAILFKMRDGAQWRNTLKGKCPDLQFEGYTWAVRNPDFTVCENVQSLKVLQSGEVCVLGKFEKVTSVPKTD
jgi:hypothetical protein